MDTIISIHDKNGRLIREQTCFAFIELTPVFLERYALAANPQNALPSNFSVTPRQVPVAKQVPMKPFDCRMPTGGNVTVPYRACPSCQVNLLRLQHTDQCPNCGQLLKQ